jgi:hypothetical protein
MSPPASSTITVPAPAHERADEAEARTARGVGLAERVAAHPLATGLAVSLLLALLASRGFLFRPGWVAYSADFSIHSSRRMELENWLTGWNHFVGDDNSPILSVAPLWLLLLSVFGTAMAQKLFVAGILFTASASAFFLGERWARDRTGSSPRSVMIGGLCALCYTINPWVATEFVHFYYVWLYALLPVTIFLMARALRADSFRLAAGNVLLVGVVAVATLTAYGLLFHLLVAGTFLAVDVVASRGRRLRRLRRSMGLGLVLLLTVAAVSAYSILPVLLGFRSTFAGGTSWALFTTEAMYVLSPFTPFFFAVRGLFRFTSAQLIELSLPRALFPVAAVVSAFPPLLVGVRLLLRRLDRRDAALLVVLGASLLIANGTNWPAGDRYATVAQGPFSSIAFVLFKGPYKLLALVVAAMVLLSIRTVIALFSAPRMRGLAVATAAGMAVWSVIMGSPLLTGDLASYMQPVEPPAGYVDALRSVESDDEEGGRAVWLPTDITGEQQPAWAPRRPALTLHGGTVTPPAAWLSPVPVSSRGTSYSPPAAGRIFDQLFTYAVMNRPDVDLARLLQLAGRAHVVLQRDVGPQRHGPGPDALGDRLSARPELSVAAETAQLTVFSAARRDAVGGADYRLAVGGHEQLLLSAAADRRGSGSEPFVLSDDMPTDRSVARRLLTGASGLWFSPGQSWEDLALNSWSEADHVYDLAAYVTTTRPLTAWRKTFFESNDWVGTTGYTGPFGGDRFGPALSGAFLFTEESATVAFRPEGTNHPADVWVRAFVNPGAGTLEVSVDGVPVGAVDLSHDPALGWKWFRMGTELDIGAGERVSLRIDSAASGPRSVSALDRVAVVPSAAVAERISELDGDAAAVPVAVGGAWESFVEDFADPTGRTRDPDTRLVDVPRGAEYRVAVSGLGGSEVLRDGSLGGVPLTPQATDGGWQYSSPVRLDADVYVLRLPGLDPRAFVTIEEVAAPGNAASGPTPTARPAASRELQAFLEPFNPGWRVSGDDAMAHVRLNGFVNGFLVDEPQPVEFGPDEWVRRGRWVSLVAASFAVVAGIVLSRGREDRRRRRRASAPRHRRTRAGRTTRGEPAP